MADAQTNASTGASYDYSQYPGGYQYPSNQYSSPQSTTTTPAAVTNYNYGYNYTQSGYGTGYDAYNSGQYGYNQGYNYNNYYSYNTTSTAATTTTQSYNTSSTTDSTSATQPQATDNSGYGTSGASYSDPSYTPIVTSAASTGWGQGNYDYSSNSGSYTQQQSDYQTNQSASNDMSQSQTNSGSQQSWGQQGFGNQSQTNAGSSTYQSAGSSSYQNAGSSSYQNAGSSSYQNAGSNSYQNAGSSSYPSAVSSSYQTPSGNQNSNSYDNQYTGNYGTQRYDQASSYDNSSKGGTYYSGIQQTSSYSSDKTSYGNYPSQDNQDAGKPISSVYRGRSFGNNSENSYSRQSNSAASDPNDEYDARNYRDSSNNRNDSRQRGRGGGFSNRGRDRQGSSFPGLKGQWSDDNDAERNYRSDNRGGRGSFGGSGGGRGGNVFNNDNSGYGRGNDSNKFDGDSGGRGGRGGYGGGPRDGNRGGFRGGHDNTRGSFRGRNDRGNFGRGGVRGNMESNGGRGRGQSKLPSLLDSVVKPISKVEETSESKPWTNTTPVNLDLKRKHETLAPTNTKKKKEEEMVDVMPFIKTHIEEHCTVNEDARKMAEESLKKMMLPGFCVLCNARMGGLPQATMHYQGKNHNKKIKHFITSGITKYAEKIKEDANKTKEQIEKERLEEEERNRILDQKVEEGARRVRENLMNLANVEAQDIPVRNKTDPGTKGIVDSQNPDFCHLCTVEFSSLQQAEQHYQGKNHKKRLKHMEPGAEEYLGQFMCEICNVRVNTQEVLNQHLNGARHKAKANKEQETKKQEFIVPEGGLVVEGGPRLKPGQRVPAGFKVLPYREPTKNENFTSRFEGPAGFFSDTPTPIEKPEDENASKKKKTKPRRSQPTPNMYNVI